jgi:hypothetical protein
MNNQYRKRIGWSSPFLSALQKKRSRQGSCGFPEKSTNFSTKTGIMNNRLVMLMHHGIKDKPGKCREIVPREVLRPEKGSAAGSVGVKPH